jgi:hypothetical protein
MSAKQVSPFMLNAFVLRHIKAVEITGVIRRGHDEKK